MKLNLKLYTSEWFRQDAPSYVKSNFGVSVSIGKTLNTPKSGRALEPRTAEHLTSWKIGAYIQIEGWKYEGKCLENFALWFGKEKSVCAVDCLYPNRNRQEKKLHKKIWQDFLSQIATRD